MPECEVGGCQGRHITSLLCREVVTTEWTQGSAQEVAWSIFANHGGGYTYRLCK